MTHRLMDGVDPHHLGATIQAARRVPGVQEVSVRGRWMGRSMILDVTGQVDRNLTVENAETIGAQVIDAVLRAVPEDANLERLDEPKRPALTRLRQDILAVVPDAEQCISYAVPAFKVAGTTVAGFAAFKNHLSYLPHSGSVFPELTEELEGYEKSSGAVRFPIDRPLPAALVEKLIAVRIRQAFPWGRAASEGRSSE